MHKRVNPFTKWLKATLWIALPLLPVVVLALAITGLLPYKMYAIHTGSMAPTLPLKSLIVVHHGDFKQGDVIAFHKKTFDGTDEITTHRFVATNANGMIVTKGDANDSPDTWPTQPSDVVGGVVLKVPQLGYWLVYIKNPAGFGSIVLFALLIWLLWPMFRRRRNVL